MSRTLVSPVVRPLAGADRLRVEALTLACGVFRPAELKVALEVFDAALGIGRSADPDYETAGVEQEGQLAGWACWGPVPCTEGTFDLYWIAVDPAAQGQGLGGALLSEMERRIAGRARLVMVETAGRIEYDPTRAFYERKGFRVAARIADYYEPGDDLVMYVKSESGQQGIRATGKDDHAPDALIP